MGSTNQSLASEKQGLPACLSYGDQFSNTDFNPPIPFEPSSSDATFTLEINQLDLVELDRNQIQIDKGSNPFSLQVTDGKLLVSSLTAVEKPRFFDFNIRAQLLGSECILPVRISLLPKRNMLGGIDYEVLQVIGRRGGDIGAFTLPYGTDFNDETGDLVVSDCSNQIIQSFDLSAKLSKTFGAASQQPLSRPADVKYHHGEYFVAEETTHTVAIFNEDGKLLKRLGNEPKFASQRNQPGVLHNPLGVALTPDGDIVVVEQKNNRLSVFDEYGKFKHFIGNQPGDKFPFVAPYYIDIHPDSGTIAVTNRGAHEVLVLDSEGNKIKALGRDILHFPHELTFDAAGAIWVADYLNRRLVRFNDDSSPEFVNLQPSWGRPKTVAVNGDGLIAVAFASSESFIIVISTDQNQVNLNQIFDRSLELNFEWGSALSKVKSYGPWDLSPNEIYSRYCASCHNGGHPDAPLPGVKTSWEPFSKDLDELLDAALSGNNIMLQKGGCYDCTEDQIMETIKLMLPSDFQS